MTSDLRMSQVGATPVADPTIDADIDPGAIIDDDDGDHDRYTHIVIKSDLDASQASGRPVRALCGKIWMPNKDPSRFPVCPTCKEIASKMGWKV